MAMAKRSKLLLFDVDCTLVNTGGAGISALKQAIVEVFGGAGPPLDLAGSTDSGIVRGIFGHFGATVRSVAGDGIVALFEGGRAAAQDPGHSHAHHLGWQRNCRG